MKVMFIPIVIGAHGTIPEGLVKGLEDLEIRGQVETILTTVLLKVAEKKPEKLRRLAVTQTPVFQHLVSPF